MRPKIDDLLILGEIKLFEMSGRSAEGTRNAILALTTKRVILFEPFKNDEYRATSFSLAGVYGCRWNPWYIELLGDNVTRLFYLENIKEDDAMNMQRELSQLISQLNDKT